mmetsp:Transcript_8676/g.24819  ORF Transcript_8676/g.24819 Transcript_8676/m.24819 type:complete len:80 (+) Transcript_8676:318-557(+)
MNGLQQKVPFPHNICTTARPHRQTHHPTAFASHRPQHINISLTARDTADTHTPLAKTEGWRAEHAAAQHSTKSGSPHTI